MLKYTEVRDIKNNYSNTMIIDGIDYDGKLNKHEDYLKMLNLLETKCKFIGITENHELIDKFKNDVICIDNTSSWWGIESMNTHIYYIKSSKELFKELKKYETFSKYIFGDYKKGIGDYVEITDFGYNDIAFFDDNDNILLRTNTHEGFVIVNEYIDKLYRKN